MRACMTVSGGAMFIPDTITRKTCKKSYKKLCNEVTEKNLKSKAPTQSLFSKPELKIAAKARAA